MTVPWGRSLSRPLGGRRPLRAKSCALNWDNHGCSRSGRRCLAERCRSPPRDAACRWVQGVVGSSDMDCIAGCFHLYSQKFPLRTALPEQTGGCAAPAVLIPERFRTYRCVAPSVAARFARAALSSRLIEVLQYRNLSEYGRLRLRWSSPASNGRKPSLLQNSSSSSLVVSSESSEFPVTDSDAVHIACQV
jgi:hypothetical protein